MTSILRQYCLPANFKIQSYSCPAHLATAISKKPIITVLAATDVYISSQATGYPTSRREAPSFIHDSQTILARYTSIQICVMTFHRLSCAMVYDRSYEYLNYTMIQGW